ncbi:MAG: site-specific integrase [Candidatus Eremiobacteraeota bacterium]|nr:site-specific integrase [Candidatus Eremiobacteraeota bacterium]
MIARCLGMAGVTSHSCRHALATWATVGGDPRSVAAVLDHASASTTLKYVQPRRSSR